MVGVTACSFLAKGIISFAIILVSTEARSWNAPSSGIRSNILQFLLRRSSSPLSFHRNVKTHPRTARRLGSEFLGKRSVAPLQTSFENEVPLELQNTEEDVRSRMYPALAPSELKALNNMSFYDKLPLQSIAINKGEKSDQRTDNRISKRGMGSEFLGKRTIEPELPQFFMDSPINKRRMGSEFLGKRGVGSEFLGKRGMGSEFLGKRGVGSEFLGKRGVGSEFLGKRGVGSEFLGKRSFEKYLEVALGDLIPKYTETEPNSSYENLSMLKPKSLYYIHQK